MNKDQTYNNTTWDFNGYRGIGMTSIFYSQAEWNATLMTKINMISNMIARDSHRSIADTIEVNPKMMGIIGSMLLFNANDYILGGRFNVIVNDSTEENTIYVYNKAVLDHLIQIPIITTGEPEVEKENKINNKTFIKKKVKEDEKDVNPKMLTMMITFKLAQQCSDDEVSLYRRKLAGYIDVENF